MDKRFRWARVALSVLAGAAATWLMLGGASGRLGERVSQISDTLASTDASLLAPAFLLYAASICIRAFRMHLLSSDGTPSMKALRITAIHAGLGHALPLRLSDVALVGLLRGYASVPAGQGTGIVIIAKLLDVASLGLMVSGAILYGAGGGVLIAACVAVIAGAAGILLLPFLMRLLAGIGGRFGGGRRARGFMDSLAEASAIWMTSKRRFAWAFVLSVATWAAKMSMFVLLARAVGLQEPPFWQIFLAGAVTDLIMALPVHGLFSLGTAEAGWTAGFAVLGVSGEGIVSAGFGVHILWMMMAFLGLLAAVPLLWSSRPGHGGGHGNR